MSRTQRTLLSVTGVAVFVLAWHLSTLNSPPSGIPGPMRTLRGLAEIVRSGVLAKNIVASVFRVSVGFTLGAAAGIPLGVWMGWRLRAHLLFNPVVQALRPISPIAWLPVATLLLGSGDGAAVFLIFLASFFPIAVGAAAAVRNIEPRYLRAAENFGVQGFELARRVIVPAALPQIITGLRVSLGIAWVVVVAAEMLGVTSGLGYQINDARNNLRFDLVVSAMVVIGAIGYLLDAMLRTVERREFERRGGRPGGA